MRGLRIIFFIFFVALAFYFQSQKPSRSSRTRPALPPSQSGEPVDRAEVLAPQSQPARGTPIQPGTLYADAAKFQFAVYVPGESQPEDTALLKKAAAKYKSFQFVENVKDAPKDSAICFTIPAPIADYKPPSEEMLKFAAKGLSAADKKALTACKHVIVATFATRQPQSLAALKDSQSMMLDLAKETKGYVWDEATRMSYSADAWKAERVDAWTGEFPDVSRHMEVHFYQNGEFCRMVTLGMENFGLPDVSIEDATRSDSRSLLSVMNLVCQTMLEKGKIEGVGKLPVDVATLKNTHLRDHLIGSYRKGATGIATIQLAQVTPQKGDAGNRLLEIQFPAALGQGLQVRQQALIMQIFGGSDGVKYIKHDEELLAARDRAKEKIRQEFKLWKAGLPVGEEIMVKAPFKTPSDSVEWMWVEVTQWNDDGTILGILGNDPFDVPGLKSGAKVKVTQESLFDYIHTYADGHMDGNETGAIIEKMEGNEKTK